MRIGTSYRQHRNLAEQWDAIVIGSGIREVYDRIYLGDNRYDIVKGFDNCGEKMLGYFPQEEDAIHEHLERVIATVNKAQMFFAEKAVPPFVSTLFGGMICSPAVLNGNVLWQVLEHQGRGARDEVPAGPAPANAQQRIRLAGAVRFGMLAAI